MDVSSVQAKPQTRVAVSKPKPHPSQPNKVSHPLASTQRTRTVPPPPEMRRVCDNPSFPAQLVLGLKEGECPAVRTAVARQCMRNESGSGTKPMSMTVITVRENQEGDSSFDVSLNVVANTLEEAMKVYD